MVSYNELSQASSYPTHNICVYVVAETFSCSDFQELVVTHEVVQQSAAASVSCMSKDLMGSYQQLVTVSDKLLLNKKSVVLKAFSKNLYLSGDWYLAKPVASVIVHCNARCLCRAT